MANIFITRRVPEVGPKQLKEAGHEVTIFDQDLPIKRQELLDRLTRNSYDAVLTTLSEQVDEEVLDAAGDSLKIVANFAVGYNNVDVEACTRRGVLVSNTPDVLSAATADQAMMLMLAVARRVVAGHRLILEDDWRGWAPTQLLGQDVTGQTLGIVGMGRIGLELAQRALAFDMTVLYHNRSRDKEVEKDLGVRYEAELEGLLERSDFVSLHCPLTDETHHLIGEAELKRMKPDAILVNTARGPVVDEAALVEALKEGWIWGAGLDVFEFEPEVTDALKTMPNVVLAPHLGSATRGTRAAMVALCAEAIIAALKGELVEHILNPKAAK